MKLIMGTCMRVFYLVHVFDHPYVSTDVTDQKRMGTLNYTSLGMYLFDGNSLLAMMEF